MYQYQLQKYSGMQSRYRCPECNHRTKTFTLYINTQTNEPLASHVGKCDREDKCGYHFTPKMWFGEGKSIANSPWTMVKPVAGKKNYGPLTMVKEGSIANRPWTMVKPVAGKKNYGPLTIVKEGKSIANSPWTMVKPVAGKKNYGPLTMVKEGSIANSPWTMVKPVAGKKNYVPLTMVKEGSIANSLWTMVKPVAGKKNYGPLTMDYGLFKQSLNHYHRNNLITFLTNTLGADVTQMLIEKYHIGTAKHWPGATVFWQIDIDGNVRTGKIMLYNPTSGKRVKQPYNHITWVHTLLRKRYEILDMRYETQENATDASHLKSNISNLTSPLFGEHLLAGNTLPVAIAESEKTAMIASVFMPQLIWLATGGLSNLSAQKCSVLKNRQIYLFPDVNAFSKWQAKASQLNLLNVTVFNYLELAADDTAKQQGCDIADYLLG